MIKQYFSLLNSKAILIIGFLLAYPIALIATNSIPIRLPIKSIFYLSLLVWLVLHFIKPIKRYIGGLFFFIQILWFFSLSSHLPYYLKEGMEYILPGGTNLAAFIYDKLYGEFYAHLILWIRNFLMGEPQFYYDLFYKVFIIYIISAIMIVVLRLLEKRIDWKFFLFAGFYFIIAWFIYVSSIRGYFAIYFIGLTVYKQFHIYENLVENAKGLGEGTRYYNYTSAIMVGAIIMVSVLFVTNIIYIFLPIESMNNKVHQVIPSVSSIRSDFKSIPSSRVFNFSSTMYSPNDYLGGPIAERDYSVIMRVKSSEGSLYLRGRAKNIYDGTTWTSDFETYRNNINNNPESLIPSEHLEEITLYPETLKTRTIFAPYKYYSSSFMKKQIFGNEDDIVYRKSRTNLSLERYSVQYIKPEFIHLYDPFDESLLDNYLQLPEEGLSNTIALTKRVTIDLEDPYEIMKTLERYLRDNYRYTLNTQEVNTDLDFVENFLFEEQKGYCTYFATSLAVMGRIAGVPTRYVEGFITSNFTDFDGYYEVSANRAHAWTEAYIEGRGWVRFEATPAYLNGDELEQDTSDEAFVGDPEDSDDFASDRIEEEDLFEEEGPIAQDYQKKVSAVDVMLIIVYIVLIIGFIYLVFKKIKRLRNDVRLGTPNEKIIKRIGYLLSMARLIEDEIDPTELPKLVIISKAEVLDVEISAITQQMIDEALYSKKVFTEAEFEQFNVFFMSFERAIKRKLTSVMYFTHKVLLNTLYHKSYYT